MVDVRAANPDGSRVRDRRVIGGTKLQARAWGVERERELIEGRGKPVKAASVTFNKFLAEWWPTYKAKGYRPSAIRFVEKYLRVHLVPHFGDVPLDKIDRQALDKFVATLFAKPGRWSSEAEPTNLSSTSVQHTMDVLHTVLVAAEDWKLLDKLPKFPTVKRDARGLSLDFYDVFETERLLVGARDEHDRLLLLFALHTGRVPAVDPGLDAVGARAAAPSVRPLEVVKPRGRNLDRTVVLHAPGGDAQDDRALGRARAVIVARDRAVGQEVELAGRAVDGVVEDPDLGRLRRQRARILDIADARGRDDDLVVAVPVDIGESEVVVRLRRGGKSTNAGI